ncbi:S-formylglutathione hydrolase [Amphritea balenae]|uniref:S-formylglutathione hydrolase n=1 Tax=Amphritea balenae TaxID=452629 RepID=A0A3P1SSH1_9GAMM|nr:S-formylglutathione hydrolase [Amphritea balenae]RRC99989.1 S-formylglutathione hydrolase [Amphritea balenae]GGK75663.1 S-formylglutathione hydrolase [Amphritea balenae]
MTIENISRNKSFGGWHKQYSHRSSSLNCDMRFAIYLPPQTLAGEKVPVLYWLSGLTCSDENFMQKAGAQRIAAELGIAIVAPDTSPRGDDVADDPDSYDLGKGAGFYVNATQAPWQQHYRMYDYVVSELPALIEELFPVTGQRAIAGHSMGGHGALTIAMHNPDRYSSVSAFSPICNPMTSPWGVKALTSYLGGRDQWLQYDASELMKTATEFVPALVDQGKDDQFFEAELKPDTLSAAAKTSGYPLQLQLHEGYDHSYYFIASFIEQHLRFHAGYLKTNGDTA